MGNIFGGGIINIVFYGLMGVLAALAAAFIVGLYLQNGRLAGRLGQSVNDPVVRARKELPLLELSADEVNRLTEMDKWAKRYTSFLWGVAALFPMFGILGTVLAVFWANLEDVTSLSKNFQFALGTTIFGLIGAIVTRLFVAMLEPGQQQNSEDLDKIRSDIFRKRMTGSGGPGA
ncbi:MAG: MotA/TolQ/ExbB proton channel family protein [Planctomycetes bacterium]|nr:MotA/TolQ/ExbB proton channel family protein [Planctomycetota bacterium]